MRIFPSYNTQAYYVNSRAYDTFSDIGNALGNASYQFQKSVGIIPDPQTHLNPQVVQTSQINKKTGNVADTGTTHQLGGPTLAHSLPTGTGTGDPIANTVNGAGKALGDAGKSATDTFGDFLKDPCAVLGIAKDTCTYLPYIVAGLGVLIAISLFKK